MQLRIPLQPLASRRGLLLRRLFSAASPRVDRGRERSQGGGRLAREGRARFLRRRTLWRSCDGALRLLASGFLVQRIAFPPARVGAILHAQEG